MVTASLLPAPRDITLLTPGNEPIALSSLWEQRPAVLVFLRHFG